MILSEEGCCLTCAGKPFSQYGFSTPKSHAQAAYPRRQSNADLMKISDWRGQAHPESHEDGFPVLSGSSKPKSPGTITFETPLSRKFAHGRYSVDYNSKVVDYCDAVESPTRFRERHDADKDLEIRVFETLENDPNLAQATLSKLKDQLPFISPLFNDADTASILDGSSNDSSSICECASSGSPSGASSSGHSKTSTTSSGMTPATSLSSDKNEFDEDGEDTKSKERPRKKPKIVSSKRKSTVGHRRLRCHFHAKCPVTHNQKTCIASGWLSIHNLRYVSSYCFLLSQSIS